MVKPRLVLFIISFLSVALFFIVKAVGMRYKSKEEVNQIIFEYISHIFIRLRFDDTIIIPDILLVLFCIMAFTLIATLIRRSIIKSLSSATDVEIVIIPLVLGSISMAVFILFSYFQNRLLSGSVTLRYLRPTLMVTIAVLIFELVNIREKYSKKIILFITVIIVVMIPGNIFFTGLLTKKENRWLSFSEMYTKADVNLNEKTKIIYQGLDHYCIYASFPAATDWVSKLPVSTQEELSQYLCENEYDYFVTDELERTFYQDYQDMFEGGIDSIKEHSVYNIIIEGDEVKFSLRESMK